MTQARIAGTQCLIAVKRYILTHNKIPSDLAAAVKETTLKAVPIDPFDGQPMRYKIMNGNPIVYSVGPNQKDDGAAREWFVDQEDGDFIYHIGK
jgi:hypothetical protein